MGRSIRTTFLLWMTIVLAIALGSFGFITHRLVLEASFDEVDAKLFATADILAATVARPPRRPRDRKSRPPERERPPPQDRTRPPSPRGEPPPPPLPRQVEEDFLANEAQGAFFVVWNPQGRVVDDFNAPDSIEPPQDLHETPRRVEQEGRLRRVIVRGPRGSAVMVGRSVAVEEAKVRDFALTLAVVAAGLWVLGLGGILWSAGRALAPIERMAATAETISVTKLDQRLDAANADNELGRLARVLNQAFDRLQSAFERQAQFTGDASHELRTPLTVIASETELALNRERTAAEYREALESCQRSAKRMQDVVDSLLFLARADSDPTVALEPVEFREIVESSLEFVGPLLRERRIECQADLSAATILGDGSRLSRAVTNLLVNAIRYSEEGDRVQVHLDAFDNFAVLTISDDGIGIEAEHLKGIFERFYRVDRARSRKHGGSGLGLAIVAEVVRMHGGEVSCDSDKGKGSTFTIKIPLATN